MLILPTTSHGLINDEDQINAFEVVALRQLLCVLWSERKYSDWVLEITRIEARLLEKNKKRKLSHFGHILRKEGSCLEEKIIQGTTSGQ